MNVDNFEAPSEETISETDAFHDQRCVPEQFPVDGASVPTVNSSLDAISSQAAPPRPEASNVQYHSHSIPLHTSESKDEAAQVFERTNFASRASSLSHYRTAPYPHSSKSGLQLPRKNDKPLSARSQFLRDLPSHDYILPTDGVLNFTMAEIIAVLPNWFRTYDMAFRFHNNGLTAVIHFAILEEHRELNLCPVESMRARDHLSDTYRKTMRAVEKTWMKASHRAPDGWNTDIIAVNGFVPAAARAPGYQPARPVPFKSLAEPLKKLPSGADAGDLTRAIEFAMKTEKPASMNQGPDFVFPDDIYMILEHIGRTQVTKAHTDPSIVIRYGNMVQAAITLKKQRMTEESRKDREPVTPFRTKHAAAYGQVQHPQSLRSDTLLQTPENTHGYGHWNEVYQPVMQSSLTDPGLKFAQPTICGASPLNSGPLSGSQDEITIPPSQPRTNIEQDEIAAVSEARNQGIDLLQMYPIPESCRIPDLEGDNHGQKIALSANTLTVEEMDAIISRNQDVDFVSMLTPLPPVWRDQSINSLPSARAYPPSYLLRNCVEADDENNQGDLARAARWARTLPVADPDWTVEHIQYILHAMESAPGRALFTIPGQ